MLTAAMLIAAALAPVHGDAGQNVVHFRAQNLPNPGDTSPAAMAERAVLQAFLRLHPEYRIEPFTMPLAKGQVMDTGPLMAIAAGVPPHAIYVNFRQSSTYLAQGFLEPLEILLARLLSTDARVRQTDSAGRWLADPSAAEIAAALEQIRQRVPRAAWPVVYREAEFGQQPHAWAVPTSNLVMALLYRKDLFYEAGLDPDRPPDTWDELLAYARALTNPRRQQYGMLIYGGPIISWGTYTFLVSNGARAVEHDGRGNWLAAYGSAAAAEAVEFVWRLCREPFEAQGMTVHGAARLCTDDELALLWRRGQGGMLFSYLNEDLLANINPQLVGVAPVPRSPRGTRASEVNCAMLGVFSRSTPQQKLAAMRYVWFVSGDEARRIRTDVYVANDMGRFVNPDHLRRFGYERLLRQVPRQWLQTFQAAMNDGVPEPYGKNTQYIYRYMSEPINAALELPLNTMPRDQALAQIRRLLENSAAEVNSKVMGLLHPDQRRRRSFLAGAVMLAVAAVFAVGIAHVWRYFTRMAAAGASPRRRSGLQRSGLAYAMLAPALLLILLWAYVPLAGGLAMAFVDYQLVRESVWVGAGNFAQALWDDKFWSALGRTFYFVALTIGLGFWPPILLAILLQEVPGNTARYFFRTIYYLPAIASGLVVMFLWKQLYDPSPFGVLNRILLALNALGPVSATLVKWAALAAWLSLIAVLAWLPLRLREMSAGLKLALWSAAAALGLLTLWPLLSAARSPDGLRAVAAVRANLTGKFDLRPLRWLASPEMAMLCVVIPSVWAGSGPGCILYLAALKTVPDELYEAAAIDGAGWWHRIFYIVLPQLRFLIIIQFVGAVIGAFRGGTEYIMVMTGGGPNNATNILALEIFTRSFLDLRYGTATAMAWMLGALLIAFTAYQLKMLSRAEFRSAQ